MVVKRAKPRALFTPACRQAGATLRKPTHEDLLADPIIHITTVLSSGSFACRYGKIKQQWQKLSEIDWKKNVPSAGGR